MIYSYNLNKDAGINEQIVAGDNNHYRVFDEPSLTSDVDGSGFANAKINWRTGSKSMNKNMKFKMIQHV